MNDLYLGDLPALPEPLAHVRVLNLNAVKLTEQGSNAFLRAFPKLRTLTLNRQCAVLHRAWTTPGLFVADAAQVSAELHCWAPLPPARGADRDCP